MTIQISTPKFNIGDTVRTHYVPKASLLHGLVGKVVEHIQSDTGPIYRVSCDYVGSQYTILMEERCLMLVLDAPPKRKYATRLNPDRYKPDPDKK